MVNLIIGTAGHVDHGKTELIKALTGINTDRLKEEKERGISIELGFAFLDLPGGLRAGIVDVPGHEKFIKNMLAGVGGMDMVILVIAADEGIMPQTREHLDIIELLQIKWGVVVLTKVDLVDEEWLSLVSKEVVDFLKGTVLEYAPLQEVSSMTGSGITELKEILNGVAQKVEKRSSCGLVRLPVDRVFSLSGFGTVVTGTMNSGAIKLGDTVEVMPQDLKAKVRNIHVHGEKVEQAGAGQRVAVNISGLEVEQIPRGSQIVTPGVMKPSFRIDARLKLLKSAKKLKNRTRVRFYLGTAEIFGRIRLLDREELNPGEWAYVQLELESSIVSLRNDRFVIRTYSPMRTIGGGTIINSKAAKYRRYCKDVLESIAIKEKGEPSDLILDFLEKNSSISSSQDISDNIGFEHMAIKDVLQDLVRQKKVKQIAGEGFTGYLYSRNYKKLASQLRELIDSYHQKYPLREGYPKEELRSRKLTTLNSRQFQALLQSMGEDGFIVYGNITVSAPSFTAKPDAQMQKVISLIESKYLHNKIQPPAWKEVVANVGLNQDASGEILGYLVAQGILVKVSRDLMFHYTAVEDIKQKLIQYLDKHKDITVAQFRDIFNTSRKYALPLLEFFDQEKITRREGDIRFPGIKGKL